MMATLMRAIARYHIVLLKSAVVPNSTTSIAAREKITPGSTGKTDHNSHVIAKRSAMM
jgi:hypothetical protein